MRSRSNAKGNVISNSFMWIAGIITALLCIAWVIKTVDPTLSLTMDYINNDVENIQKKVSDACNSVAYLGRYNPRTEDGNFTIHDNEVCIENQKIRQCAFVVCDTGVRKSIDLHDITFITIQRDIINGFDVY